MSRHVSIIIPCYNARPWIEETIASAVANCGPGDEIVVIDDGSSDGSSEVVRERFPDVPLIQTPNRGVSHARNLGIEKSSGEYLVFLDADDLLTPGKIARQKQIADRTGVDVVYGNWQRLRTGPDGKYAVAETVERQMTGIPEIELFLGFWCPTGAYLFRRRIVDKVGGFNLRLPVIQDQRFVIDCATHGATFEHDHEVACLYRVHTSGSVSTRSQAQFLRDCLTNAPEVRDWWEAHGGITQERNHALFEVFNMVAIGAQELDQELFEQACTEIHHLQPDPLRWRRPVIRLLESFIGYRKSVVVRSKVRTLKRVVSKRIRKTR
ncbi:MAG TPA: glycosyltransferase [Gemmataceae bacterium]|nr:glycosyltransferase [Gemmataceae bacterium]